MVCSGIHHNERLLFSTCYAHLFIRIFIRPFTASGVGRFILYLLLTFYANFYSKLFTAWISTHVCWKVYVELFLTSPYWIFYARWDRALYINYVESQLDISRPEKLRGLRRRHPCWCRPNWTLFSISSMWYVATYGMLGSYLQHIW